MDFVLGQLYNGSRYRGSVVDSYSRKSLVIHALISFKGSDVVHVMESVTFRNPVQLKRVNVRNDNEFVRKVLN
ncbi:hypothetical protein [Zobellia roscoffensis]|uniref:hypothetical protein n=1 Tax=Zobellia roscoffensis TaxID=2779508 RepID=UPI00188DA97D|nr:hypothetical protein [Zobellia roscoffensis]